MNKSTSRTTQAQTVRKRIGRTVIRSEYVMVALSSGQPSAGRHQRAAESKLLVVER
jgi:hypothetical protein